MSLTIPKDVEAHAGMADQFEKKTGFAHLIAATTYSWGGFWRLVQESAFRHELTAYVIFSVLLLAIGATLREFLTFTLVALVLFAVEALNTAIEEIVDRISPELSSVGKHAKDLGSFAVFCLLTANGLVIFSIVLPKLF